MVFRVALVKRETFQRTRKSTEGEIWLAMRRCDANSCRTVADVRQTSAGENTTTLTRESHLTCTSGVHCRGKIACTRLRITLRVVPPGHTRERQRGERERLRSRFAGRTGTGHKWQESLLRNFHTPVSIRSALFYRRIHGYQPMVDAILGNGSRVTDARKSGWTSREARRTRGQIRVSRTRRDGRIESGPAVARR